LDPSDSYFLFADLVGFYTHWTYMHIFRHIFLSNYWWQRSGIWSQASYRYPISWEAFFDPSGSYFLFVEERGYHKWALAHSSSCFFFTGCCHFQLSNIRITKRFWLAGNDDYLRGATSITTRWHCARISKCILDPPRVERRGTRIVTLG
jgi:hypothetical protein